MGVPVYTLANEMPYSELLQWQAYFDVRPIGWRDDSRFMRILQAIGIKEPPERVFHSLALLKKSEDEVNKTEDGKLSIASLKRSALFGKMLQAQGGDSFWGNDENTGQGN